MAGPNVSGQFSSDVSNYIAEKVLPLARRLLVAYQFGDPLDLPEGNGVTYTATRFNRVPLPFAPLSEGVRPPGQTMNITQVTATAMQWGDTITVTDVAEITIKHPVFKQACRLVALQSSELLDRNTYNNLLGGTQVNTVNQRGSRASILNTDVLNIHEINRATGTLLTLGSPRFDGDEETDAKRDVDRGGAKASADPRSMPHYSAICHPLVMQDLRENSTFVLASSYSDINKLYNAEFGEWGGIRFCQSNMVPNFVGVAAISGTAGTAGTLATGSYFIKVTASDAQNQYESQIYQTSGSISVTGASGSISVVLPSNPGFTFNIYIGTTSSPVNLGLSAAGPTTGPLTGQATQLAPGQTVIITGAGIAQVPPAAPATGVTVYPTFIFGRGAYGQVVLSNMQFSFLKGADKSDPLNQFRIVGWKCFYGTIILNQLFFMRIESGSAFSATFA